MNKSLIALAMGTFALGIAEFSMMGILNDVASSLMSVCPEPAILYRLMPLG